MKPGTFREDDEWEDTKESLRSAIIMENEMIAVEEALKIEVGEIKIETAECGSELFAIGHSSWELANKDDGYEYTNEINSNRIKNEQGYQKIWNKCDAKNWEAFEMKPVNIKLEKDLDTEKLEVKEITEEVILKNEDDCDRSMDENSEIVLNRISNECKVEDGTIFTHTTAITKIEKLVKIEEMDLEISTDMENCQDIDVAQFDQNHSCANENPNILMKSHMKQEILRKQHNVLCEEARKKSFSCYNCSYTACHKYHLISHMKQHKDQKTASPLSSKYKNCICMHCHATFKSKAILDNHTIRKHPDSIASVSSKIHKCPHCTYASTLKACVTRHMLKHPETAGSYKLSTCIHCNATFKQTRDLDEHTIRKHPDFIASVSSKIYKCPYCTYASTIKTNVTRHMLQHPETAGSCKPCTCIHCNATFKSKIKLDEHTIRKHPDFFASVSSKIHRCTHCTYASTSKTNVANHMLKHPETSGSYKLRTCIHCNATFTRKVNLDGHTIKKHPDFIASVSSKIYECPHCTYTTISNSNLIRHMLKHSETGGSTCTHCNATFKSKVSLDDHIVRKHPDFIASVSSKIFECPHCTYTTISKSNLTRHMFKHSETVGSYKLSTCTHCNATFKCKVSLDDHTIRKHPDFIASISSKIYECPHCTYTTTLKSNLTRHLLRHSETAESYKLRTCIHCNATFKRKIYLDDHTIRKHPDFIASVSSKIYECPHCTYASTFKTNLASHMLKHPETAGSWELSTCIHCNAIFKSKQILDDHTIRKHPDFNASVSSNT